MSVVSGVKEQRRSAGSTAQRVRAARDALGKQIDLTPLAELLEQIEASCNPAQVWLFGSQARGDARPGSDWDLLVIVPDDADELILDPQVAWRMRKASGVRADIFVCRESDFVKDRGMVNTILFDVAHDGVLVYER